MRACSGSARTRAPPSSPRRWRPSRAPRADRRGLRRRPGRRCAGRHSVRSASRASPRKDRIHRQSTLSSAGLRNTRPDTSDGRSGSSRNPGSRSSAAPSPRPGSRAGRDACRGRRAARAQRRPAAARSRAVRRSDRARRTRRGRDSRLRATPGRALARGCRRPPSSTSRVAYRSTTAAAGSSRNDSSTALASERRIGRPRASRSRSFESRCRNALAIIASVVSMPPNSSTPASDATSARESDACIARRRRNEGGGRVAIEGRLDRRAESLERLGAGRSGRPPRRDLGHRPDDRGVPAECRRGIGVLEPERVHHGDSPTAGLPGRGAGRRDRRASIASRSTIDLQPDELGEPCTHGVEPERARERLSVPRVLGAVEREHARPDHLSRSRSVDRRR